MEAMVLVLSTRDELRDETDLKVGFDSTCTGCPLRVKSEY